MKYSVFFPATTNIHFGKHIFHIPRTMHQNFGMDAEVITFENGDYSNLEKEVPEVRLSFIQKKFRNTFLNKVIYILKNAKKIDILEFIHRESSNYILNILYKLANRKGISFLKMDVGEGIIPRLKKDRRNVYKELIRKFYTHQFNCIGVESREVYQFAKKYYQEVYSYPRLFYLPNGYSVPSQFLEKRVSWSEKENIILTVGRVGSEQKATEIFLEALAKIERELEGWKVYFVGQVVNQFENTLSNFFEKHPDLKGKIVLTGWIGDREKLCQFYQRSKIFCLPSRWEGFPNVLIEAAFFKNYIISTKLSSAKDILDQGRLGALIDFNDPRQLSDALKFAIQNENSLDDKTEALRSWILENFNWKTLCNTLHQNLFEK